MASQQVSGATIAQRPQPQTTDSTGAGPFVQHAKHAQRPAYTHSGLSFGQSVTDPLPQAPGYAQRIDLRFAGTGGVNGSVTVAASADATTSVATVVNWLQFKDPMGTPVLVGSGFGMLYLVPMFGGQYGLFKACDITTFPSYSAFSVGGSGTGNFNMDCTIPLEGSLAYGLVAMGNASALPTLQINLAQSSTIFPSVPPGTLPTIEVDADIPFYGVSDPSIMPDGLGTTYQWVEIDAPQLIGSASSGRIALGRTAGYLHTLILVLRDSTGARVDNYGSRIRLWIDGVMLLDQTFDQIRNQMYRQAGGQFTRPTGVICYSWRESISQVNLGLADTNLRTLPVTPGSLIEVECTPWGTISNAPAKLTAVYGTIVPRGNLVTGLTQEG